jgi:hypothetical protein
MASKYQSFSRKFLIPKATEPDNKKDELVNWGKDNLYPYWLSGLVDDCAIHCGIIKSKVHYTISGGLKYTGTNQIGFEQFLKNSIGSQDMAEVYTALSNDLEIYDGMAVRGVWNTNGTASYIESVNMADIRKHLTEEAWWYCEDWTDTKVARRKIPVLNLRDKTGEFILVHLESPKKKLVGRKLEGGIYPTPSYSGGIRSILTDIEISKYDLSEIVNGFMMGTLINFANGVPENDEDKNDFESSIKDDGQGAENANSLIVTYSDGKEREPTVHSLTGNNLADRYIIKGEAVTDKILRAHSVTSPLLFGVKEAGQLGGTTELEIGYSIMKANYFANRQQTIASMLQYLMNYAFGIEGELEFNEVAFEVEGTAENAIGDRLNTMSPLLATKVLSQMTVNEVRSLALLPPVEGGDEIIGGGNDAPTSQFSKDKDKELISHFSGIGKPRNEFKILKSLPLTSNDFEAENGRLLSDFKKFDEPLTAIQKEVLKHIGNGETFNSIVKATGLAGSVVARIYQSLTTGEFISETGELKDRGMRIVAESDQTRIEIRYSYELRPDAPPLLTESRPFCKELIALDRLYTREEIDFISSKMGFSVWNYRGGWYHNPETGRNTPFCRHTWQQNVIFN